ncbi:MAG: hypothetical protein IPK68_01225 [Bdellovibrionales bacterium]|nr:hypothetical protein [Bdellovibrionales bacterium]
MKLLAPMKTGRSSFLFKALSTLKACCLAWVFVLTAGWGQAAFAIKEVDGGSNPFGQYPFTESSVPGDTDSTPGQLVTEGIDALAEGDGKLVDAQPIEVEGEKLQVAKPTKEFALFLDGLGEIFAKHGPVGVVQQIELALAQNKKLQGLIKLTQSEGKYTVTVRVHPNAVESVTYLNQRFVEMGLNNLVFAASEDPTMEDPTALPRDKIKLVQPLRIGLGVGVALAAATLSLPSLDIPAREFLIAGVPAMSVGAASAALEYQFAARGMNRFWNKFFSGGPVVGRIKNIGVNIAYGMILYGAGMGASQLPTVWGGQPIPVDGQLALTAAVIQAAIQGVWYNAVMGQFQTDIGLQQRQGKLKAPRRYVLETFGVVINNSGRVLGWIIPGNLGTYAQMAFFFLQTLPKAAQTYLFDKATDARIYRAIHDKEKPGGGRWKRFARSCAQIVNPGH